MEKRRFVPLMSGDGCPQGWRRHPAPLKARQRRRRPPSALKRLRPYGRHPSALETRMSDMIRTRPSPRIELSVVIPLFNEEPTLKELHRRLGSVLDMLAVRYEIIFVDDGSVDGTF